MAELYTVEKILDKRKVKKGMIVLTKEDYRLWSTRSSGWVTGRTNALGSPLKI